MKKVPMALVMASAPLAALLGMAALLGTGTANAGAACAPGITAVGPTSCPFAFEVAAAYMARTGGYVGSAQLFDVPSPVTGEDYNMTCAPLGYRMVVCRGGNNAEVILS
jgi:hypothetical protein